MADSVDIRSALGDALDAASVDAVQSVVDDILDLTKLKAGIVDFTCKKCGHKAEYKASIVSPDYKARADAIAKLIEVSKGRLVPEPVTSPEIEDSKVEAAVERVIRAMLNDDELTKLANA